MRIIIVGAGKVGELLCKDLTSEGNDITLIEENAKILEKVMSNYDINGFVGNGTSFDVLIEAGVESADIFIAVTQKDEINTISSILAKKLGAKYTLARVREVIYSNQMEVMSKSLGIDKIINPELEAAKYINQNLYFSNALNIETFFNGKLKLVEFLLEKDSYLDGISLLEFKQKYFNNLLVCIIKRNNEIIIPQGNVILKSEDLIYVSGVKKDLLALYKSLGKANKEVKSVFIIGGSITSQYLSKYLLEDNKELKVIEIDEEVAKNYNENFPNVLTIVGDGTDEDVLEEESFKEFDACIAMTGIDEINIFISIYAKQMGLAKIITKINKPHYINILDKDRISTVVTPRKIIADQIIKTVRTISTNKENILNLHRLEDNRVEVIEFLIDKDFKYLNQSLKILNIKKNVIISYIIRNDKIIIPSGNDVILEKDRVIIITTETLLYDINEIVLK